MFYIYVGFIRVFYVEIIFIYDKRIGWSIFRLDKVNER